MNTPLMSLIIAKAAELSPKLGTIATANQFARSNRAREFLQAKFARYQDSNSALQAGSQSLPENYLVRRHPVLQLYQLSQKMGNSQSGSDCVCDMSFIVSVAIDLLNDFFSRSFIGQMATAFSSSRICKTPFRMNNTLTAGEVEDFLECQFLNGIGRAYELIMTLILVLLFIIAVLGCILYKRARKAMTVIKIAAKNTVSEMGNQQTTLGEQPKLIRSAAGRLNTPRGSAEECVAAV